MYIVEVFEALLPSRKSTPTFISRISGLLALGTMSRLFIYHGSLIPKLHFMVLLFSLVPYSFTMPYNTFLSHFICSSSPSCYRTTDFRKSQKYRVFLSDFYSLYMLRCILPVLQSLQITLPIHLFQDKHRQSPIGFLHCLLEK